MQLLKKDGPNKEIRKQDMISGVIYGSEIESIPVMVPRKELLKTLETYGQNAAFDVDLEGDKHKVYVKEIQREVMNPVQILHFDLLKVSAKDKIQGHIPVILDGKDRVESQGFIVQQSLKTIEAKYSATETVDDIVIDISTMSEGDSMIVSELELPTYVEVLDDPEASIFSIQYAKKEQETEDTEQEIDASEVPTVDETEEVADEE